MGSFLAHPVCIKRFVESQKIILIHKMRISLKFCSLNSDLAGTAMLLMILFGFQSYLIVLTRLIRPRVCYLCNIYVFVTD